MDHVTSPGNYSAPDASGGPLYDRDFLLWIATQLEILRAGKFNQLDLDNVIEEFASMGKSQHRELSSRLEVLLMHLLKSRSQPAMRCSSWLGTIREQRSEINRLLKHSPSLRHFVDEYAQEVYAEAVERASLQTGLPSTAFPAANPFSPDQLLNPNFLP